MYTVNNLWLTLCLPPQWADKNKYVRVNIPKIESKGIFLSELNLKYAKRIATLNQSGNVCQISMPS